MYAWSALCNIEGVAASLGLGAGDGGRGCQVGRGSLRGLCQGDSSQAGGSGGEGACSSVSQLTVLCCCLLLHRYSEFEALVDKILA